MSGPTNYDSQGLEMFTEQRPAIVQLADLMDYIHEMRDIFNDTMQALLKAEGLHYYESSTEYGIKGDGITDESDLLQSAINEAKVKRKTLFLNGTIVVSKKIDIVGEVMGGTIILTNNGVVNMKDSSKLSNTIILTKNNIVSESALLFEEKEASAKNIVVSTLDPTIKNVYGVHFKGTGVTCFNTLENAHIRFAETGVFIDSSENWVTNIELDHIRVDYFNDYAIRVGSLQENIFQNSQHNISNITIQDTGGTKETRIGLSTGDTWSNYNNIVTFADNEIGEFRPLHMPFITENIVEIIRDTRSNSYNGIVLEGKPLCNGYAYLHNLNGVRLLNNRFDPNKLPQNTVYDTKIKTSFKLSDGVEIKIPTSIENDLIIPANVSFNHSNGKVTVKNLTNVDLYFLFDIKIPVEVEKNMKQGKYSTVLINSTMGETNDLKYHLTSYLCDENGNNLEYERIAYFDVINGNQLSFSCFHTNDSVLTNADEGNLYLRIGISNLPKNETYTFNEIYFYNQLVPVINETTSDFLNVNLFN